MSFTKIKVPFKLRREKMLDKIKLYQKDEWNYEEFEFITGVKIDKIKNLQGKKKSKKGKVEKPLLRTVKVKNEKTGRNVEGIRKDQLFKIAIYLFVMNIGTSNNTKSVDGFTGRFNSYFNENRGMIIDILLDENSCYQNLLKKIKRADENDDTRYMLNLIKFLEVDYKQNKINDIPLLPKSLKFKDFYKTQLLKLIADTITFYKTEMEAVDIEQLENSKKRLEKFFYNVDLEEIITRFQETEISRFCGVPCYPLKIDNSELFEFLDSNEGVALNEFTMAFYQYIDVLIKYSTMLTQHIYTDKVIRKPGIPTFYSESIKLKDHFKMTIGAPYLGYSDHEDGYYLQHKILHLRHQLPNYDNALNDLVKVLQRDALDINVTDKNDDTLVRIAVNYRDLEAIKILKRFGADPFSSNAFSYAILSKDKGIIEQIIDLVPDQHFSSLLKYIYEGEVEPVKLLLDSQWSRFEKYFLDEEYESYPLGLAVLSKNLEVLMLLREKVNDKDYTEKIINVCVSLDNEELAIEFVPFIDPLDFDDTKDYGSPSYLGYAYQKWHLKFAKKLLEKVDPEDERINRALLELAIWNSQDEMWDLFLNKANDLKITIQYGRDTTLNELVNKGAKHRIEQLIGHISKEEYPLIQQALVSNYMISQQERLEWLAYLKKLN